MNKVNRERSFSINVMASNRVLDYVTVFMLKGLKFPPSDVSRGCNVLKRV